MAQMLITEALQQLKIITDRISKKREVVLKYVTYSSRFVDPLAKQGGSQKVIAEELQAVADLEKNLVTIRTAIQRKNLELSLTVEGETKTVAEWLIWRRDVSERLTNFQTRLAATISNARTLHESELKRATATTVAGQEVKDSQLIVNIDELALSKESEKSSVILGNLDSKLSILNAVTTIEF